MTSDARSIRPGLSTVIALITALAAGCTEAPRTRIDGPVTILEGVTVIDGTGAPARDGQVVAWRGDRLVAVGAADTLAFGPEARRIDGRGRTVIPGLIDTHAHITILPLDADGRLADRYDPALSERVLQLLLASGITTVRNPAAPTADGVALRDAVRSGAVVGPRIVTAGAGLIRSAAPFGPFEQVRTPEAVREAVRRQAAAGVDWIKVYSTLPPTLVQAALDEAHAQGVPVVGHLQATTWTEAARLGIDALTHGAPWTPDLLPPEARAGYRPSMKGRITWLEHLDLDAPAVIDMIATLATEGVTLDPTLVAYHTKFWGTDARYRDHPALSTVPASIRDGWMQATFTDDWTDEDYRRARAQWPTVLALTKRLFDAGVLLTTGSDTPNPWVVPGAGLHDELALLADAGIPPLDVLTLATANGARSLDLEDEIGTLEAGKHADLVVLTANPLDNLRHTRAVEWILLGGVRYTPEALLGDDAPE